MSYGGVNAGVVLHQDMVVAIHGKENTDSSVIGRMVGIRKPSKLPQIGEDIMLLGSENEVWRNNGMEAFTSSPVYRDSRIYVTIKRGELVCLDAGTGEEHWVLKLAPDQVHASPTWADGKLYVPTFNGKFFVVKDAGDKGEIISEMDLGSACLAAPSMAYGRVFVQTKKKLFCFGSDQAAQAFVARPQVNEAGKGEAVSLQVVPAEFALKSGSNQSFKVYSLDQSGRRIKRGNRRFVLGKMDTPNREGPIICGRRNQQHRCVECRFGCEAFRRCFAGYPKRPFWNYARSYLTGLAVHRKF